MIPLPTNRALSVKRNGQPVAELAGLSALVLPARPEVVALQESTPAGKLFEITFTTMVAVRETDQLVSDADPTETYRVTGVATFDTPLAAHTEVVAERRLGTA